MNNRRTGSEYEARAAEYLTANGYRILERNFRCRQGEIDLIAQDGSYLVFVEVKYRSSLARRGASARTLRSISTARVWALRDPAVLTWSPSRGMRSF